MWVTRLRFSYDRYLRTVPRDVVPGFPARDLLYEVKFFFVTGASDRTHGENRPVPLCPLRFPDLFKLLQTVLYKPRSSVEMAVEDRYRNSTGVGIQGRRRRPPSAPVLGSATSGPWTILWPSLITRRVRVHNLERATKCIPAQ